MADVFDKGTRSYIMSRIKGKDTKPEMLVRRFLHGKCLRYVLHDKKLPGKPDLAFPKYRTVVFVNGCFWHGHEGCKYYTVPKSDTAMWEAKIAANQERDRKNRELLEAQGWRVIVVWECSLKGEGRDEVLEGVWEEIAGTKILEMQLPPNSS